MKLESKKLRTILYERDLTQKELSKKANLTFFTINKVCNGGSCRYETGIAIAKALGLTLDDLLEKKGE